MNFKYVEQQAVKNELVKIRLCRVCSKKLPRSSKRTCDSDRKRKKKKRRHSNRIPEAGTDGGVGQGCDAEESTHLDKEMVDRVEADDDNMHAGSQIDRDQHKINSSMKWTEKAPKKKVID